MSHSFYDHDLTLPRKLLPTDNFLSKVFESSFGDGFGKYVAELILGIYFVNGYFLGHDVLSEMMELNCEMFCSRSKLVVVRQFEGADIVFVYAIVDLGRIELRYLNSISMEFLNKVLNVKHISHSCRQCSVFCFSRA